MTNKDWFFHKVLGSHDFIISQQQLTCSTCGFVVKIPCKHNFVELENHKQAMCSNCGFVFDLPCSHDLKFLSNQHKEYHHSDSWGTKEERYTVALFECQKCHAIIEKRPLT